MNFVENLGGKDTHHSQIKLPLLLTPLTYILVGNGLSPYQE